MAGIDYVESPVLVPELESRKLLFLKLSSLQQLKQALIEAVDYYRRKANPFSLDLLQEQSPEFNPSNFELEHKVYKIGGFSQPSSGTAMKMVLIKPMHTVGDFDKTRVLTESARQVFEKIRLDLKVQASMGITGPYSTRAAE